MHEVYPITVVKDRYNGTYSCGKWTAWNCHPWQIPDDIFEDDVSCCEFWGNKNRPICGIGDSAMDAILDLYAKLHV